MGQERAAVARQLAAGATAGVAAWLVGYLVTYVLYGPRLESDVVSAAIETWQITGLLFYNAHAVTTEILQPFDANTQNFLATSAEFQLLYVLPPVVLGLAGLSVAHITEPDNDLEANVRAGGTIVVGYGLLSIVGLFAFATTTGDTHFRPDPVTGVLVAGILYPLAFGALGGLTAAFVRTS